MTARARLAASPLARLAALPFRMRLVARQLARLLWISLRWLVRSREHTNHTYPLTALNLEHLAWFASEITGAPRATVVGYIEELVGDEALRRTLLERQRASRRSGLIDREVHFGRRIGWYVLVRTLRPRHVVETGTDKGLGSMVLAAALLRNGEGRLTTIDINPDAGQLIGAPYDAVIDRLVGSSLDLLATVPPAELFIHDSDHAPDYERAELDAVRLTGLGVALSDNGHVSDVLPRWAEANGRRFLYFHERPEGHWYPGAGIGASWDAPDRR